MQTEAEEELVSEKFTWIIESTSMLKTRKHSSDAFFVGGVKWQIIILRKRTRVRKPKPKPKCNVLAKVSVYLDVADTSTLPSGWSRNAKFSLIVVNQLDSSKSIKKEHEFVALNSGSEDFIHLSDLCLLDNGYIVNDVCVIEAEVSVHKGKTKALEDQETGDQETGEFMDFRGLGRIEKAYVPLIEEACSWHPSLIECQKKRSGKFIEWAFTALGRVLHFLKTTKVKDMTADGVEHLQLLWDELETCKFDLAWLEPSVQSALDASNTLVEKVKQRREDVHELENAVKCLRVRLVAAELDLDMAKRDLSRAEQGFMDRELGYDMN